MSEDSSRNPRERTEPDLDEVEDDVDADAMRRTSWAGNVAGADEQHTDQRIVDDRATASAPARRRRRLPDPPPASLRDMLEARVPTFLVHRSYQQWKLVPDLLAEARREVGGRAGIGAVIRLPKMQPANARHYLDLCTSATMKIADPEIHALSGSGAPQPYAQSTTRHHRWTSTVPTNPDPAWIRAVLESQMDAGANVLLSASGWVSDANGRAALAHAMEWVRASRAELGDEPMFVNLTFPASWLTTKTLLDALKEELVESTETLWWLRFYWPIVEPRYGQLRRADILDGYRELARTAAIEDKVLILPNTGLTGWVATAWGAQGFSTGTSWTEQMYGDQLRGGSTPGRPKPPPVERYFDRTLLHTVPHAEHLTLRGQPNHLTCHCRFCRHLDASATYHQPTAHLHYLLECARLTAQLGGRRPGHSALRAVRDAQRFIAALPTALTRNSRPLHLTEWERRLP